MVHKVREVLYKIIGSEREKKIWFGMLMKWIFRRVGYKCTCIIYKVREVLCIDIYVLGICGRWIYVSIADLKHGVRFLHIPR